MSRVVSWIISAFVVVLALLLCVPLWWMIKGSFTTAIGAMRIPPEIVPSNPTLTNYRYLFVAMPTLFWMRNSAVIATAVVGLSVLVNTSAGWALSRRIPAGKIIFWTLLVSVMIPGQVTLIPSLVLIRRLALYNTLWAMIVPALLSPIMVFFYREFVRAVPREFLDAAKIDGAGELTVFFRVLWPLTTAGITVIALTAFTATWSNYFWQLIVVNREELRTLPVGVALAAFAYKGYHEWAIINYGFLMAGATVAFLPMLVVFLVGQRYFIDAIYQGGLRR